MNTRSVIPIYLAIAVVSFASSDDFDWAGERNRLKQNLQRLRADLEKHSSDRKRAENVANSDRLRESINSIGNTSPARSNDAIVRDYKSETAKVLRSTPPIADPSEDGYTRFFQEKIRMTENELRELDEKEAAAKERRTEARVLRKDQRPASPNKGDASVPDIKQSKPVSVGESKISVPQESGTRAAPTSVESANERAARGILEKKYRQEDERSRRLAEQLADQLEINRSVSGDIIGGTVVGAAKIVSSAGDFSASILAASNVPGTSAAGYGLKAAKATVETFSSVQSGNVTNTVFSAQSATLNAAKATDAFQSSIYKTELKGASQVVAGAEFIRELSGGDYAGAAMTAVNLVPLDEFVGKTAAATVKLAEDGVKAGVKAKEGAVDIIEMQSISANLESAAAKYERELQTSRRKRADLEAALSKYNLGALKQ